MRRRGTCVEIVGMGPHDHVGWVFSGARSFEDVARQFLAGGAVGGEQLMFVADDPDPLAVDGIVDVAGRPVTVASIAEVYGASGVVDPVRQRATFAQVLDEALAAGYRGIRVAADNSPLVRTPERLAAWIRWESVADHFMSENPVTGLCAFDGDRVDVHVLRHLATLHPLVSASSPAPQYQLFADDEKLWVEGVVDTFTVDRIWHTVEVLPAKTALVVDLEKVTLFSNKVVAALAGLARSGVDVVVQGPATVVREVRDAAGDGGRHLRFAEM